MYVARLISLRDISNRHKYTSCNPHLYEPPRERTCRTEEGLKTSNQIVMLVSHIHLAAIAGFLSHILFFVWGEHHMQAPKLSLAFSVLSSIFLVNNSVQNNWRGCAVTHTVAVIASYGCTLFTSIIIYRFFFHRLRHFPGPFLARVSKLWHVAKLLQKPNFILLDELHEAYGDFVRIGEHARSCQMLQSSRSTE